MNPSSQVVTITQFQSNDQLSWDQYVQNHPHATLYHLSGWKNVIEKTYGHKTYYLMAVGKENSLQRRRIFTLCNAEPISQGEGSQFHQETEKKSVKSSKSCLTTNSIVGVLPLVHLKHFLFGNSLISIPFFDTGGILADNEEVEKALLSEAIELGQKLRVDNIELRHIKPLSWLSDSKKDSYAFPVESVGYSTAKLSAMSCAFQTRTHKVRMLLNLPDSSEKLMKSFKSNLRRKIRKPLKEGLSSKIGGLELLEDFYKVFSINMRDLGSPVHAKKLMRNVVEEFPEKSRIVIVNKDSEPWACSLIIGFKNILENPWVSALREYRRLYPNMLLYWTMLEYACDNDYNCFDFGRSSPDEGTYKFKKQWGAKPNQLNWHYISPNSQPIDEETSDKSKFDKAIRYWQKLPIPVTKAIGPRIRKHIGL